MFGFFCSDSCFQKVPAEWHESQPFLCLAGTPLWVCAFYQVFISGHLGRFHFVAIVNSAAVKVHIRFLWGHVVIALGQLPGSGIAVSYILIF